MYVEIYIYICVYVWDMTLNIPNINFMINYEQRGKRMTPKRRATSSTKAGGKKVKEEPEAPPKDKFTSAKEALKATVPQVKGTRNLDSFCHLSNAEVRLNK